LRAPPDPVFLWMSLLWPHCPPHLTKSLGRATSALLTPKLVAVERFHQSAPVLPNAVGAQLFPLRRTGGRKLERSVAADRVPANLGITNAPVERIVQGGVQDELGDPGEYVPRGSRRPRASSIGHGNGMVHPRAEEVQLNGQAVELFEAQRLVQPEQRSRVLDLTKRHAFPQTWSIHGRLDNANNCRQNQSR
jgi:hypothetical protein